MDIVIGVSKEMFKIYYSKAGIIILLIGLLSIYLHCLIKPYLQFIYYWCFSILITLLLSLIIIYYLGYFPRLIVLYQHFTRPRINIQNVNNWINIQPNYKG